MANKTSQIKSIERVLTAWRASPPGLACEIEEREASGQLEAVRRLLKASRFLQLPQFDPFSYCGVIPLERYTRDFFAAMLDAGAPHGIAATVFRALLDQIATVNRRSRSIVQSIQAAWDGSPPNVEKEQGLKTARPDVLITGNHFLIAIEIKRRLGVETQIDGVPQSKRLHQSALLDAQARGISEKCVLVIYLTPDGQMPIHSALVPLNAQHLFDRIERGIGRGTKTNISKSTQRSIRSYMDMLVGGAS